jgi:hypothetical protein
MVLVGVPTWFLEADLEKVCCMPRGKVKPQVLPTTVLSNSFPLPQIEEKNPLLSRP